MGKQKPCTFEEVIKGRHVRTEADIANVCLEIADGLEKLIKEIKARRENKKEETMKETKCPDCGTELKACCIDYILMGRPKPTDSELQKLLKKNAFGMGLTIGERMRAQELISNPEFGEKSCVPCNLANKKEKAIFDTGLCQAHAQYALATRK